MDISSGSTNKRRGCYEANKPNILVIRRKNVKALMHNNKAMKGLKDI